MTDRDDSSLPSVGTSFTGLNGPVIKIVLGDGQVRRIGAHRVAKDGKPSHGLLRALVARYAFPDKKRALRCCDVTTTYVDEDGDVVTIATDDELEDALSAVVAEAGEGRKQVLKINATAKEKKAKAEDEQEDDDAKKEVDADGKAAKQKQNKQQEGDSSPTRQNLSHSSSLSSWASAAAREVACGSAGKLRWDLLAVDEGELDAESKDVAEKLVRSIVASISSVEVEGEGEGEVETKVADGKKEEDKKEAEVKEEKDKEKTGATERSLPAVEPLVFIHARHTCDGCGVTPIMGVRYRAVDRTDFDLCHACFQDPRFGASDLKKFVPEELECDRAMQHRWARRFRRGGFLGGHCQGSLRQHWRQRQHCPVSSMRSFYAEQLPKAAEQKHDHDDSDKELQEALLRSASDASATKGVKESEKAEEERNNDEKNKADAKPAFASTGPIPDGIAAAIAAALSVTKVAGAVAVDVMAIVEKELKRATEQKAAATAEDSTAAVAATAAAAGGNDKPDENASAKCTTREKEMENGSKKQDQVGGSEGLHGSEEDAKADQDEAEKDVSEGDASEKSEWEDIAAESKEGIKDASEVEDINENEDDDEEDDDDDDEDEDEPGSCASGVAAPLLSHWAEQLAVLRQLGFTDDRKSVDALEALQAANVGVDSTDKVTVGDAVNYLLKNVEK